MPVWSPTGGRLVFLRRGHVYVATVERLATAEKIVETVTTTVTVRAEPPVRPHQLLDSYLRVALLTLAASYFLMRGRSSTADRRTGAKA